MNPATMNIMDLINQRRQAYNDSIQNYERRVNDIQQMPQGLKRTIEEMSIGSSPKVETMSPREMILWLSQQPQDTAPYKEARPTDTWIERNLFAPTLDNRMNAYANAIHQAKANNGDLGTAKMQYLQELENYRKYLNSKGNDLLRFLQRSTTAQERVKTMINPDYIDNPYWGRDL